MAAYNPETRETVRKQTGSYYTPRPVVDYMVDEALVESLAESTSPPDADGQFWRERLHYLLDYEDAFDDANEPFDDAERKALVQAIAGIRVLDPAVGSGAFPMGVLHKLTLALHRLDPGNESWESIQKEFASQRATAAFDTASQQERDAELKEISDTFEKYRDSDFGRKLYLIQNSIFGVDIQPVATQIAKLRFFISLAIEQEPDDDDDDNYGIKPLPNLETRFVAANTLLGLAKGSQVPLVYGQRNELAELQAELNSNRERHFHATTRSAKLDCRKRDGELRNRLSAELTKVGMSKSDATKISNWDPYDQNASADWFDAEYMFGVAGGFDVVIGNPPYIESRSPLISSEQKTAYGAQVIADWGDGIPRGSDLLVYFYARSAKLLRTSGLGCLITQNAWLSTDYGHRFQQFSIGRFSFLRIIDSSAKFFSDVKSQNINAVITTFTTQTMENISYGVADNEMAVTMKYVVRAKQDMKWGHLFAMPEFFRDLLSRLSTKAHNKSIVTFGQGLNLPRKELDLPGAMIPIIDKAVEFVAKSADGRLRAVPVSRKNKVPSLIMPRGVGDRYYCIFNLCRAYSFSAVEMYLPVDAWESDLHYCLWAYMNSSFVWLFRETTGRKNLGGGMLKAEATDMKALPVEFDFDFGREARRVFAGLGNRHPLPVSQEIHTEEHLRIDDMVAGFFDIHDVQSDIRAALIERVSFRTNRASRR